MSGKLSFADGRSPSGARVGLELRPVGSPSWEVLGSAVAGSDGDFSAEVTLPHGGSLRAVAGGDGAEVVSANASVTVVPRLTARVSSPRLRAGRVVRLSGGLEPAPAAERVSVYLQRRRRGRWVTVRRRNVRVRAGRYDVRLRLPVRGLYRISVGASGAVQRRLVRAVSGG